MPKGREKEGETYRTPSPVPSPCACVTLSVYIHHYFLHSLSSSCLPALSLDNPLHEKKVKKTHQTKNTANPRQMSPCKIFFFSSCCCALFPLADRMPSLAETETERTRKKGPWLRTQRDSDSRAPRQHMPQKVDSVVCPRDAAHQKSAGPFSFFTNYFSLFSLSLALLSKEESPAQPRSGIGVPSGE